MCVCMYGYAHVCVHMCMYLCMCVCTCVEKKEDKAMVTLFDLRSNFVILHLPVFFISLNFVLCDHY